MMCFSEKILYLKTINNNKKMVYLKYIPPIQNRILNVVLSKWEKMRKNEKQV